MGLFKIDPKGSVEHDLKRIDRQYISKILHAIENLATNPFYRTLGKDKKVRLCCTNLFS